MRAVERALVILKAFTAADSSGLPASELARRVDLSLPTLYRLLYTLENSGFIISSGEPQRFRLGPAVAHLAHAWSGSLDLAEVAEPILREIWRQTGETVGLFMRQGDCRLCVAELPSTQPLSFKRGVGYREPLVYGASGHAILAHLNMSADEFAAYLQDADIDFDKYLAELEIVRQQGYAISREELIKGVNSVAAPFFNRPGQVGGALVVFGPGARLPEPALQAIAALLVKKAAMLSALLSAA